MLEKLGEINGFIANIILPISIFFFLYWGLKYHSVADNSTFFHKTALG